MVVPFGLGLNISSLLNKPLAGVRMPIQRPFMMRPVHILQARRTYLPVPEQGDKLILAHNLLSRVRIHIQSPWALTSQSPPRPDILHSTQTTKPLGLASAQQSPLSHTHPPDTLAHWSRSISLVLFAYPSSNQSPPSRSQYVQPPHRHPTSALRPASPDHPSITPPSPFHNPAITPLDPTCHIRA